MFAGELPGGDAEVSGCLDDSPPFGEVCAGCVEPDAGVLESFGKSFPSASEGPADASIASKIALRTPIGRLRIPSAVTGIGPRSSTKSQERIV
jgi:hypothetical protein